MKKLRLLMMTLCVTVLMGSMAVTAYAGGGEEWDGLDPMEPLPAETVDPGEGFTEDGNLVTRDLLYDKATNKQFITVQTSGGNTFYIVIDYFALWPACAGRMAACQAGRAERLPAGLHHGLSSGHGGQKMQKTAADPIRRLSYGKEGCLRPQPTSNPTSGPISGRPCKA